VSRLSTDEGIEAEIRSKYPAVKQGESVAVIIGDSNLDSSSNDTATSSIQIVHTAWWEKVLQMIEFWK